jgi:hypothetical protein
MLGRSPRAALAAVPTPACAGRDRRGKLRYSDGMPKLQPLADKATSRRDSLRCVEFTRRDGQGCIVPYAGLHVDYWRGEVTEILVQSPEREVVIKTREAKWVVEGLRHRRIARIVEAGASPDGQPDVRPDTGCPVVDSITIHARR